MWKMAKLIPVFKTDGHMKRDNYRAISILAVISKILERNVFFFIYELSYIRPKKYFY